MSYNISDIQLDLLFMTFWLHIFSSYLFICLCFVFHFYLLRFVALPIKAYPITQSFLVDTVFTMKMEEVIISL